MENINKTKEELIQELQGFHQAYDSLDRLYKKECKDRKEIEFRLHERLKEKKCHNHISMIMSNSAFSFGEVMNKVAEIIPDYLLFPDLTGVSIQIEGNIYQSKKFEQSDICLEKGVNVFGKTIGKVVVCYLERDRLNHAEPFLKEEEDLIFTIVDRITNFIERKSINAALHESEQKYRKLIENINDVIYETDDQACITYISPSVEKLLGFSPKEVVGKSFLQFMGENADFLKNRFTELRDMGEIEHEYKIFSKSGEEHWIRFSTKAVKDEGVFKGATGTLVDITDRKLVEMALQKSEETFRNLVETINDAIYEITSEGIIKYVSPAIEKIVGYKVEELIDTNFIDYAYPEDRPKLKDVLTSLGEKDLSNIECRYITKGGQIRWIRSSTSPTFREGRMIGRTGSLTDINDQKLAEEELRRLSLAVKQSPVSIVITDLNAMIEYVNPAFEATTGYSMDEVMGQSTKILKSGETEDEVYKQMWETISSGREWQGEWVNKKKSGELFWEDIQITPIHDENKKIINYLAVKQDITNRKKIEKVIHDLNVNLELKIEERTKQLADTNINLLKEIDEREEVEKALNIKTNEIKLSEQKFATAFHFNSAMMAISYFDNGKFVDVNNTFVETLGYSRDELIGRTNMELGLFVDPNLRSRLLKDLDNHILVRKQEVLFRTKEGTIKTGLLSADFIYFGDKKCILTVTIDITERKQMEDELRKARIEADHANSAKSEFLSRMSHELRTPMNSILGFAQLLEMGELNSGQKKGVGHIMKSGKHLLDLINEVLDISRIEAGRLSLSLEPVQLKGIIQEMIDVVRLSAYERQLNIVLIDSPDNELFVKSDRQRLKQVLLNLINNALKYNISGGSVTLKTEISSSNNNLKMVKISVTDTGIGIAPEDIPKLFVPFERVGAEKTETEGTGLGLAVVKKLIDAMGGQLGVESTPGVGSTFWIELPQSESQLEILNKSCNLNGFGSNLTDKSGTILYIEDNLSNIELVEQILANQRTNIRVITNTNGRQAIKLAVKQKPDLILLDLNLPDIHGSEVIKYLQADARTMSIPVVIISADAMPHQLEKLLKAGARDYLTKPLDVGEFLKVIDKYIKC